MDFSALAASIWAQFKMISNAPAPFLAVVLLIAFVIWKVTQREFANRLADAASKLELADARVCDYERKLAGATPDEAATRIDALEKIVADLRPRRFTNEQLAILEGRVRGHAGRATVLSEMGYADGLTFSGQLANALAGAGWDVSSGGVIGGPPLRPTQGLLVFADQVGIGLAFTSALEAAGISFSLMPRRSETIELQFVQPLP